MKKPRISHKTAVAERNRIAFQGGTYSLVITAVVLAILVGFEVPAGRFARMAAPFRGR